MIGAAVVAAVAMGEVVSFKDANKIKSWDAWNDHVAKKQITSVLQKEKRSVPWQRLKKLDPGLKEIGTLVTRTSAEVKSSPFSVGCETMDRDYADWNSFKELLPLLGVKHARFFSGWAKTEQEKGKYDFAWLDQQLRECSAMAIRPWVCLSYGNPVWGSDFRLGMRVKQVTGDPAAFDAWIRYCKACVERYRDIVDEWEIWNEPFNQPEYAEMFYRTAKAIREVQPTAKIFCTSVSFPNDYKRVLEKLKKENALELANAFIYHPYTPVPESAYQDNGGGQFGWQPAIPLRKLVKTYSEKYDIIQGETGCPAQLEFGHALNNIEWTEYAQAKWDLRRALGDFARGIPSNKFSMIDLQYTFMLQSYGLCRSNTLKEFVYRRPSWYAMRNVYALFDDEVKCEKYLDLPGHKVNSRFDPRKTNPRKLTAQLYRRGKDELRVFWFSDSRPDETLGFDRTDLWIPAGPIADPVWVDMITGRVFEIPSDRQVVTERGGATLKDIPLWDAPVLIASKSALKINPLKTDPLKK